MSVDTPGLAEGRALAWEQRRAARDDRLADVEILVGRGDGSRRVAAELGMGDPESLRRWLSRCGRLDLWQRMRAADGYEAVRHGLRRRTR